MKDNKIIISSTHLDSHGDKMTKEELYSIAESINNDKYKPGINIEHDLTFPPLGRCINAEVIKGHDSEYYLTIEQEFYNTNQILKFENDDYLILQGFSGIQYPLRIKPTVSEEILKISVDENCFLKKTNAKDFFDELKAVSSFEFEESYYMRKSETTEPIILFDLAKNLALYFLSAQVLIKLTGRVIDKIGDKIGDDLSHFYDLVKQAATKMVKFTIPKYRFIVYVFNVNLNEIQLQYIIKTDKPDIVAEAFIKEKISKLDEKIVSLLSMFDAISIQFTYNNSTNEWEFNYLLTDKGESVGTLTVYNKRKKKLKEFFEIAEKNISIEGRTKI